MKRREFITLIAGAIVTWPVASIAQEAGRIYRLGMLLPQSHDAPGSLRLFDELRRRGFIEGQNLTIDYRDFGLHLDLISEYAAELVKAQVDVIDAAGGVAIRAAQRATKTIPILGITDDMERTRTAQLLFVENWTPSIQLIVLQANQSNRKMVWAP
jgi:putative ABC transport system substrate-binding protein